MGLLQPGNLLLWLLTIGAGLSFTRWRLLGRALILCSAAAALIFSILPTGKLMIADLENRFPSATLPSHVDGIVVLGGIFNLRMSRTYGQPSITGAAERLVALARLRRLYPQAKLVYSGGSESELARQTLNTMGTDTSRILFEDKSSSTRENALFTRELVKPVPGEVWLLVTSADHMPRAVGVFRKLDWDVLPIPVNYHTLGDLDFNLSISVHDRLLLAEIALLEWGRLLFYWMRGWTSELYPRPA